MKIKLSTVDKNTAMVMSNFCHFLIDFGHKNCESVNNTPFKGTLPVTFGYSFNILVLYINHCFLSKSESHDEMTSSAGQYLLYMCNGHCQTVAETQNKTTEKKETLQLIQL